MANATIVHLTDPVGSRRLRIHGTIARSIGIGIVSGTYPPGHLFEPELIASDALGVSRTAYREALRILAAKGLVNSRPKLGTRVSDQTGWNLLDADVLEWIFDGYPSEVLVRMLFELRLMVEPRIAALAATRRNPDQLVRLSGAMAAMEEHGLDTAQGRAADQDFHRALIEASDNLFLNAVGAGIVTAVGLTTLHKHRDGRISRNSVPDHRVVHDAVAAGDPYAAHAAMQRLVEGALSDMLPALGRSDGR